MRNSWKKTVGRPDGLCYWQTVLLKDRQKSWIHRTLWQKAQGPKSSAIRFTSNWSKPILRTINSFQGHYIWVYIRKYHTFRLKHKKTKWKKLFWISGGSFQDEIKKNTTEAVQNAILKLMLNKKYQNFSCSNQPVNATKRIKD